MHRLLTRTTQRVIDLAILSLAYWVAFMLRFDWAPPELYFKRLVFTWPYVVGFQYLVLVGFGIPRLSWRYIGLPEAKRVFFATTVAAVVLLVTRFLSAAFLSVSGYAIYALVPIGVILSDFALVFLGVTGVRVLRRVFGEKAASSERRQRRGVEIRTMLVGAGEAGVMVAKEISSRPDMGILPIGFLDDDRAKVGTVIHGIQVLGTTEQLAEQCARHGAEQVLVTIANAPGSDIRRIVDVCDVAGMPTKIIPGLYELVGGSLNLSRIRAVAIEDLLRRDPVELDIPSIANFIQDKTVLVSGAGGSIGSELCRQVARFSPASIVLVDRFENALFEIHSELSGRADLDLVPRVADVTDCARMRSVIEASMPDVIFHAAAHKHVPMMEWNPGEAVKNNILGTKCIADLASEFAVAHFVMISTDKAVNPTSIMGATKRGAELYIQGMSERSETNFVSVRFGNVLGSNGSVVGIFKKQIEAGGPVLVTHPEMRRYFMTIPEASQLVLQAATLGQGGEVFILDMGEPIRIVDLAHDLIRLSGFTPHVDMAVEFSGIRPGEKLFEELATDEERAEKTRHEKVFIGKVKQTTWNQITAGIEELEDATRVPGHGRLHAALRSLIPEFSGSNPEGAKLVPISNTVSQKA